MTNHKEIWTRQLKKWVGKVYGVDTELKSVQVRVVKGGSG